MKTKSSKAKGRRLQNWVRDELLKRFPKLTDNDVVCAIMGERGIDVKLSNKAKKSIPFAIECKNQETFKNLYKAYGQSDYNSKRKLKSIKEKLEPIVFVKINKQEPLVVLNAEYFLDLMRK
tara:strand:+ start:93 stop:455 length:363 start_codon:yes stop_codon:yes gene_type:complete